MHTSPSVDDEIDGGVEGEEEVRKGDDLLYERRNSALVPLSPSAPSRAPPAINDFVNVWNNLGRLTDDEKQRDED